MRQPGHRANAEGQNHETEERAAERPSDIEQTGCGCNGVAAGALKLTRHAFFYSLTTRAPPTVETGWAASRANVVRCCCRSMVVGFPAVTAAAGLVPARPVPQGRKPPAMIIERPGHGGQETEGGITVSDGERGSGATFLSDWRPHFCRFRRPPKAKIAARGITTLRITAVTTSAGSSA